MKTYSISEPLIVNPMWVSPDGSDETGDGTESNPYRQIRYAISKCKSFRKHNVYVKAGTYDSFSASSSKYININLHGNININTNDTNFSVLSYRDSSLRISSNDSSVRSITFNYFNNSNAVIVQAQSNSVISITNVNIRITNNINCSAFIQAGDCSKISIYNEQQNNMNTNNLTCSYFVVSVNSSIVGIAGNIFNINNTNDIGFTCRSGFILCEFLGTNNATTPIEQLAGGRCFLNTSTSTTNNISPSPLSSGDDITSVSENTSSNNYTHVEPIPID